MCLNLFSNITFALIAIVLAICYFYVRYVFSYWQRRGVPYIKPSFPFGNFGKNFMLKMTTGEQLDEIYRSTTKPFIGTFVLLRPVLIIRDTNLIRDVLIKDFQHFVDRGVYHDEANDPLSGNLVAFDGDKWKNLRTILTPTFSSVKMRMIFSSLLDCKRSLHKHISQLAQTGKITEVREMSACYATNFIASVAFGIEIDCLADPDIPFRAYGRKFFEITFYHAFRFICFTVNPILLKWTGIGLVDRDVEEYFTNLTKQTLESREKHNIFRKDFFQLLVQLRNNCNIQSDDECKTVIDNSKSFSLKELTAHSFVFFLAGFETSSLTMTYCLFEIARNPDIQRKIHEEIDHVSDQHNGEFTYDFISDLKYLECCINETLRKYSVIQFLARKCTKEYKIPGSNVTLEKGTAIFIPTFPLHRDEKFFPDPSKFDPSRFFGENRNGKTIIDMPYLPFGDGPRNCIGLRMAKMSIKVGLVSILQQHCVDIDDQHVGKELKISPCSFISTPTNGVYLKFKARQ